MSRIRGKAVVAQSGGPTAVINASAAGVLETALAKGTRDRRRLATMVQTLMDLTEM